MNVDGKLFPSCTVNTSNYIFDLFLALAAFANMNSIPLFGTADDILDVKPAEQAPDFVETPPEAGWTNGALDPFDMRKYTHDIKLIIKK